MLVLTRKPREEIRIGNGVTITILRVKGQAGRVGIDAPKEVRIIRGELELETAPADTPVETGDETEPNDVSTSSPTSTRRLPVARNRCLETAVSHESSRNRITSNCNPGLPPSRRSSVLKALVARNRAATSVATSPDTLGSSPPR